jgi:restriction system protein
MAEVTRRRTGEFIRRLFEILLERPDGMPARDALKALEKDFQLSEYEAGNYASGERRFEKIVRFATVDCVKAGWLLKTKGRWSITESGRTAYKACSDPEQFYKQAVKLFHQWKSTQLNSERPAETEIDGENSEKVVSVTFDEAEEQAWAEIKSYLHKMPPFEFQELVADLLRAMGYHVSWVAPPGKDGGIDIIAQTDPLGTHPPRIKVQVKRKQDTVSADGLRSFMALLGDDDVGLFVTLGGFTKDAAEEARTQEKRRVTLIDLEELFDLWVQHYSKLSDDARRRLPLRPIYFLAPQT